MEEGSPLLQDTAVEKREKETEKGEQVSVFGRPMERGEPLADDLATQERKLKKTPSSFEKGSLSPPTVICTKGRVVVAISKVEKKVTGSLLSYCRMIGGGGGGGGGGCC